MIRTYRIEKRSNLETIGRVRCSVFYAHYLATLTDTNEKLLYYVYEVTK